MTQKFINISESYGNPEIVTVDDYEQINPDGIFAIHSDEIWEINEDGGLVEVVARTEEALAEDAEAEEAEEAVDDGFDYTDGYIYAEPAEEADFAEEACYTADADARADAEEEARHAVDAETVDSDENGDDI